MQIGLQYAFDGLLHKVFLCVELKSKMAATTGHSFNIGAYVKMKIIFLRYWENRLNRNGTFIGYCHFHLFCCESAIQVE